MFLILLLLIAIVVRIIIMINLIIGVMKIQVAHGTGGCSC